MSYLEAYGVREARRQRKIRLLLTLAGTAFLILLISGIVWFVYFRNRAEKSQIQAFLERLRSGDYQSAYSLWGCTQATPCPHYPFDKFMEDWGPKSPQADIAQAKLTTTKSCDTGIIQFIQFADKHEVQLWVERKDRTIGFAPWPICNPRMKVP